MTRALTICSEPGCPHPAVRRGRCPVHQLERRNFNGQWRRARARANHRAHGRCERCGAPATIGHHRVYARHGGPDTSENIEMLCHTCHALEHGWTTR